MPHVTRRADLRRATRVSTHSSQAAPVPSLSHPLFHHPYFWQVSYHQRPCQPQLSRPNPTLDAPPVRPALFCARPAPTAGREPLSQRANSLTRKSNMVPFRLRLITPLTGRVARAGISKTHLPHSFASPARHFLVNPSLAAATRSVNIFEHILWPWWALPAGTDKRTYSALVRYSHDCDMRNSLE